MKTLTTLLEITDREKVHRQLIIGLDQIAPGKLVKREGGAGWIAKNPEDDDNFVWINGNQVLIQTENNEPGRSFIKQVNRMIKRLPNVGHIKYLGKTNESIIDDDGFIKVRYTDIGGKMYVRYDVLVSANKE